MENLGQPLRLLVDSGSKFNFIKEGILATRPNLSEILRLSGITDSYVKTLGTVQECILGFDTKFHVVPENFPIDEEGLLGRDFLQQSGYSINIKEGCIIKGQNRITFYKRKYLLLVPARTTTVGFIKVTNNKKTGYIPPLQITD